METDVLIVGAGPTGLMLANQLARRGMKPTIVDRHSGPAQQSRAMAVQARTLEIYSKMGLVEKALLLGARGTGANMWANGRWTARIPVGDIGQSLSPFPFVLMLGQDDNEIIMGEALRELGVTIRWNTELVALAQQDGHVEATLRQPDGGVITLRANWVAGCDGSRSAVREMCRITFPGAPYEHTFFVADTEAKGEMKPGEVNVYLWQDGFHLFFPMRGKDRWRVIGILPKHLRQRDNLTFDEVVPAIRREAGSALEFAHCSWFSTYRIHHRAAQRFRSERCFLLGDAAHVHSPMGAQGMNTGLQDAYNLAWKLALVVQGKAESALLASYEQERMPVAQQLLRTTDRAFQLIVSDNWLAGLFRTRVMARVVARAMTKDRVRQLAFRTLSQIGISYRASTLSQTVAVQPKSAPTAGDRFPWLHLKFQSTGAAEDIFRKFDDRRFNLIVVGQPAPPASAFEELGEMLRIHTVSADAANDAELVRANIPQPSFYLVRPDGHVGLCGSKLELDAVENYFTAKIRFIPLGLRGLAEHSLEAGTSTPGPR